MLLWIWIAVACAVFYLWLKKTYTYFKPKGFNSISSKLSFINMIKTFSRNQHMTVTFENVYHSHRNDRYVGTYEGIKPAIMILDPELIKQVTIKDFDHFVNHQSAFDATNEKMFSLSLISLRDQTWRDMRSTLSPAFTGSKLRNMVPLIEECNNDLLSYLQTEIQNTSDKYLDIDTLDLIKRYANDVIATCAFGLKTNSIKDKDNQFYVCANKLTTFTTAQIFKAMFLVVFPFLAKIMNMKISNVEATNYFKQIIIDTMKDREERKLYRPDMIQLLLEARKGTLTHEQEDEKDAGFATVQESDVGKNSIKTGWDEDHLLAQAFLFFFAGLETVSTALRFVFVELAVNTDVQEKLRQEIDDHYEKYGGKMNYDNLTEMKYLDMIISETLRKWPPAIATDRQCNKTYNLGPQNDSTDKSFILPKDMKIQVAVWPMHRDPKYYENPDEFDPERFSDENKHNIKPFTYLPFGVGPRNCIGSRFALVEMKAMTYGVIRRFEVSPSPSTKIPLRMDHKTFTMTLDGGHVLRFKSRS